MTSRSVDRPVSVEPMTDADLYELQNAVPSMGAPHVWVSQLLARLDQAEARALPSPRRYTGGPLEDGLYLWRREWWPRLSWTSVWVDDDISRTGRAPQLMSDKFIWLIGPITIPDIPSEEASS